MYVLCTLPHIYINVQQYVFRDGVSKADEKEEGNLTAQDTGHKAHLLNLHKTLMLSGLVLFVFLLTFKKRKQICRKKHLIIIAPTLVYEACELPRYCYSDIFCLYYMLACHARSSSRN